MFEIIMLLGFLGAVLTSLLPDAEARSDQEDEAEPSTGRLIGRRYELRRETRVAHGPLAKLNGQRWRALRRAA